MHMDHSNEFNNFQSTCNIILGFDFKMEKGYTLETEVLNEYLKWSRSDQSFPKLHYIQLGAAFIWLDPAG